MGNTLSSLYEYSQFVGTAVDVKNLPLLEMATSLIQGLCKHNLEKKEYFQWYRSDVGYSDFDTNLWGYNTDFYISGNRPQFNESYGTNIIVLNQFPITSANILKSSNLATIRIDPSIVSVGFCNITTTGINLKWYEMDGTLNTESYLFSDYGTLQLIGDEINDNAGFVFVINQPSYVNLPSAYLKVNNITLTTSPTDICGGYPSNINFIIDSDRKIIANDSLVDVLIDYVAGYEFPVDNAQHTALVTVGNVPDVLKMVCNFIVSDLISFINGTTSASGSSGINGNMLKSEHILDYSYEKFSESTINSIALKYKYLLDPFILHSL